MKSKDKSDLIFPGESSENVLSFYQVILFIFTIG
jgi:hypothetical protein